MSIYFIEPKKYHETPYFTIYNNDNYPRVYIQKMNWDEKSYHSAIPKQENKEKLDDKTKGTKNNLPNIASEMEKLSDKIKAIENSMAATAAEMQKLNTAM